MIKRDRLIKTFFELVKIDSPSGEEESIAQELVKRLKALGGKVQRDSYGNVIAKFPGVGNPIMLNSHMDTVEPGRGIKPQVNGDKVISDGTTVLGSDAKAGVSIILEALTSIKEANKKTIPIEVVLTKDEESSLGGAKNLDYSKIESKHGIVLDGPQEVSRIYISSPSHFGVDIQITGRSAHAGLEPEKGLSAIKIGSEIITLLELGRIDFETTANIGIVKGGSAGNAVAEQMDIVGEIRSRDLGKLKKHISHFKDVVKKIAKKYPEAKINLVMEEVYQGFKLNDKHPTVKLVSAVHKSLSLKTQLIEAGGGSDANIFYKHGIQVVIVGIGTYLPHTKKEYVVIPQIVEAANFIETLVTRV